MANRFTPPPRRLGSAQEIRSQVALELMLNAYAVGGALILFRAILKTLEVNPQLWVGNAIFGITDLIVRPISLVPGSETALMGDLTLVDATLVAGVVLFPLGLLVFGNRERG